MSPQDLTNIGGQIDQAVDVLREQFSIEHLEGDLIYSGEHGKLTGIRFTVQSGGTPEIEMYDVTDD